MGLNFFFFTLDNVDKTLTNTRKRKNYLDFRENRHDRHDDAEDKVQADENFVFAAVIRLCVVDIEQDHCGESTHVVHEGERQERYEHKSQNVPQDLKF